MVVFVVLEGLSGCGKSTASRLLETEGWLRVSPPGEHFVTTRALLDADPAALEARHLLFVAGVAHASSAVSEALFEGRNVVADSWLHRTNATHVVLGSRLGNIELPWLPRPDHELFLDCPEFVRQERKKSRGTPDSLWKSRCEESSLEIRSYYLKNYPSLKVLDASLEIGQLMATLRKTIA